MLASRILYLIIIFTTSCFGKNCQETKTFIIFRVNIPKVRNKNAGKGFLVQGTCKSSQEWVRVNHECYYCDQVFDSKEKLYDHLEVHADTQEKSLKKKLEKTLKKDKSHTKKISNENE